MLQSSSPPTSVMIIGCGLAGLFAALKFIDQGWKVILVSKSDLSEGATRYAQGGIAAVWDSQDTFEKHIEDTLTAGAGLCDPKIVELCVREGPARVRELIDLGVPFTRVNGHFDLHREGGHSERRILHADDRTGMSVEATLCARIQEAAKREPARVRILEHHIAIDLITENRILKSWRKPGDCLGAYILNETTGEIFAQAAQVTILATGGAGKAYLYTSNPDTATGDGIVMAYRAGARITNMEFMQFHPTCLFHPEARTFLISEALRGEGAVLRNLAWQEFMQNHHPMKSLAPRDIVARAIDMEMKRTGDKHVWLDCSMIPPDEIRRKFPHIHENCLNYKIDISREPIPVVPAAHYTCGGVSVNEHSQTAVNRLYAIGEVACTGLHGANRLASNSLLEAAVFAYRAFEHACTLLKSPRSAQQLPPHLPEWDSGHAVKIEEKIDIASNWLEIRQLMWNYVGIVRSNQRLERARRRIELLKMEINHYYWNFILTRDLIELRNLVLLAELIVQSALQRHESRGLHYNVDYSD